MKVKVAKSEGLSHELEVTLPANEIGRRVEARLREVGRTAVLRGFRKGRVPRKLLKQRFGKRIRSDVVESAVHEASRRALDRQEIKPAMQPRVEVANSGDGQDLVFRIFAWSMPELEIEGLEGIRLTRLVAEPDPDRIDLALGQIAESRLSAGHDDRMEDRAGMDDESKQRRENRKTSADNKANVDDALASAFGQDALEALRKSLEEEFRLEMAQQSRTVMKRQLLDHLDEANAFEIPRDLSGMVDFELEDITRYVDDQYRRANSGEKDSVEPLAGEDRKQLRAIAERRVRLGLIIAAIGNERGIFVTEAELQRAAIAEARRYPGQEEEVLDRFSKRPAARESLRAPLLEDKVVDYIFGLAEVTERTVSHAELHRIMESGHGEA